MNIPTSFLILNPLEALVVIMGCDIFTNRKFNISKDIKHIYILGTINLIVQIFLHSFKSDILGLLLNIFVPFIISPYITKIYYNKYLGEVKYIQVFIVQAFYMITTSAIIYLFDGYSNTIYTVNYIDLNYEIGINICKAVFQIILLFILRRIKNEKSQIDA